MGAKSEEPLGRSSSSESNGGKSGISLRQGVIIAVISYTVVTTLLMGTAYRTRAVTLPQNSKFYFSFQDRMVSNALTEEHLEENIVISEEQPPERVVLDDGSNSSSLDSQMSSEMDDADNQNREPAVEAISEDPKEEDWRDSLYHSSVVFGLGYEEMRSSFKIYVYPRDNHAIAPLPIGEQGARFTDDLFYQMLYRSDFITAEPEKAHLYLIPLSIRSLWNDEFVGPLRIGRFLNKYIQEIRNDYPYWDRTLGADHAVLVCNDYREDGSRNGLELKKNVIQISCSPLVGDQTFYPHKDFAIPPVLGVTDPSRQRDLVGSSGRRTLVYHYGRDSGGLTRMWDGDADFVLISEDVANDTHYTHLASSKYCLIFTSEDTAQVVDALRYGCVPILVSDSRMYDLPFQDVLNWNQFTIILGSNKLKNLKSLLQDMPQEQYRRKQILGMDASRHLEWHNPPKEQDAFYMALYDLWIRRHSIRYIEREDL